MSIIVIVLPENFIASVNPSSPITSGHTSNNMNAVDIDDTPKGQPRRWAKRRWTQNSNSANSGELKASHQEVNVYRSPEDKSNNEHTTEFVAECSMPTEYGTFRMRSYKYRSSSTRLEPIVMISGKTSLGSEDVMVRVHDQCLTSEVFGSNRCDCKEQLIESLRVTVQENDGIVIYLQQEGRGIGLANKVAAYSLQDNGMDTVDANLHLGFNEELREYHAVPDILNNLGINSIRLVTNNPYKIEELSKLGVKITSRLPIEMKPNIHNRKYLLSKRDRMRHFLSDDSLSDFDDVLQYPLKPVNFSVLCGEEKADFPAKKQPDTQSVGLLRGGSGSTNTAEVLDPSIKKVLQHRNTSYIFGKESVELAIEAIRKGKVVIVVDDADRENEGDFIMAADKATPETVGFIVRYSSGVLCMSLDADRLNALDLPMMVVNNEDPKGTAYTVSVDAKGTGTGISAADRALTFRKLSDPSTRKGDLQRPGHVFPLRCKEGGTLARAGHTEASFDLSRLAGLNGGGVLAEAVNDDGSLMLLPRLEEMAEEFDLVLTSVQDIIAFRMEMEGLT